MRDRLGRLYCDESHSSTGDGVWLNHIIICRLLVDLGKIYFGIDLRMARSSDKDNHCVSYLSEARELLVQRKDAGMNESEIWELLLVCDQRVYLLYMHRGQSEKAKHQCVEWVTTARQCNVSDQVDYLITALGMLSSCLTDECDFIEARALAEESYIIASKHYSPAHKTVMEASCQLISCFIEMKDFSTADTYCRMNYANVNDPINAGEYGVKDGIHVMNQLVLIWLLKDSEDDEIAEKALSDEAIDLSRKVYSYVEKGPNRDYRMYHLYILCRVLLKRNELTEETEGLLHELVTMRISENNLDGEVILDAFTYLHTFYSKIHESFRMGKKTTFVQKNIELCQKKLLELNSSNDGSVGYVKTLQKIKPYFKGNAEVHI